MTSVSRCSMHAFGKFTLSLKTVRTRGQKVESRNLFIFLNVHYLSFEC